MDFAVKLFSGPSKTREISKLGEYVCSLLVSYICPLELGTKNVSKETSLRC